MHSKLVSFYIQCILNKYLTFLFTTTIIISLSTSILAQSDPQHTVDSLRQLLEKANNSNTRQDLLGQIATVYEYQGNWELYQQVVEQQLKLAEHENDTAQLAEVYNQLGISSCYQGDNKAAVGYFIQALEINQVQNDSSGIADMYENMGVAVKDMGDIEQAIKYQIQSIEIRKAINHPRLFNNYLQMAQLQKILKNVEKQDYYLNMAKDLVENIQEIDEVNKAIFFNELGSIYCGRLMLDSAITAYKNVIYYSKQANWPRGIAVGLGNLADTYKDMGMPDSAIICHKKSLKLSEQTNDCMSIAEEYVFLAELYNNTGRKDSVLFFANRALKRAEECDLLVDKKNALLVIADYYLSQGDYQKAYEYKELFHSISDSLNSVEKQNNIAELETKFQTQVKEQQIALLTNENQIKNQRMWLFIAMTIVLILAVAIGVLDFIRRKKRNEQHQETLRQQLLRSQMNPHFLFNALGSIQNYMYKNDARTAAQYLNNFARLTRSILEHSDQEIITLDEEIETIHNYLELEKMQSQNGFEYRIDYDQEMDTEFIRIPPMLVQPFVENAIKHGIRPIDYKGELIVKFTDQDDQLFIEISDNGTGIDQIKKKDRNGHKSMSMNIFEQRRQLLAKKHKTDIKFNITDRSTLQAGEHGTLVRIELPIGNTVNA